MRQIIAKSAASIHAEFAKLRPGTIRDYALALVATAVATGLRLAIDPYVVGVQYITFVPAILVVTLIGGFGAGLLCVVLSAIAAWFFVIPPRLSLYIYDPAEAAGLLLFGLLALFIVIIITRMRIAIEREQAAQALQVSKDRLQLALDTAQLGWWHYDPRRRVLSGDRRFKEIFGVTSDEMPIEDIRSLIDTGDVDRFLADRKEALDPGNPRGSPHEYRVQRRDGEVRWVEVRWLGYFDGDRRERGAVSVVGSAHDVTERKQREEREQFLMREINHRAKNMLSVVAAIAHQSATRTPEGFIERFSERIQALAANQDLLIRNAWRGIEIEDLVSAQLAPWADLVGSRIEIRGPKLHLKEATAQAIGLALHELATNAGKYGALSTDAGRVDVCWETEGDAFTVSWIEREGPPVSAPRRRGFGTIVMETMAERSVDAKVDLDYAPSGLTWRLACRAANALEPR
jgi:PAS domain S-box-containing protein